MARVCCHPDGTCSEHGFEDLPSVCPGLGLLTHPSTTGCAFGVDCQAFVDEPVSCCVNVGGMDECLNITRGECFVQGGSEELPAGCGDTISCGGLAEGACCVILDSGVECLENETRSACEEAQGVFHQDQACADVGCVPEIIEVGCRGPLQDLSNYTGYDPGVKIHSLDLCEMVVVASVRHRSLGGADLGDDVQPGHVTPVTAHEVRAAKLDAKVDPCLHYTGSWRKGVDGYIRPHLCSKPEGNGSERLNVGFGFKQKGEDEHDRIRPGYVGGVCGVETPRWSEIVYRDNPVICVGVQE